MKRITFLKIIIAVLINFNVSYFYAQQQANKIKPLFGSNFYSTGNGHGGFYSFYAGMIKGKNIFRAGPIIQKCSMKASGFRVSYSRILTLCPDSVKPGARKDLFQLNFFTSLQYSNKLPLSPAVLKREKLIWGDSKPNLDRLLLSTGELTVGFEFYVNITDHISWKNYAGASVYYNFNYSETLDHQRIAPTLGLGTGICLFL